MANVAKHKEALVRTAVRLFRRQGYASTGLQQILTDSGAPKGSLYHYFPAGKDAVGAAAVDMAAALIAEMLAAHAARHRAPRAFVRAWARTMAGWMRESDFRSGCPIATTLLETAPQSAAITAAGNRAVDGWIAIVAGVLARGSTTRRDARRRAELLVAAMEGALILARVRRSTRPILDVATLVS